MNYELISTNKTDNKTNYKDILESIKPYLLGEKNKLIIGGIIIVLNSLLSIISPYALSYAIDNYIGKNDINGLLKMIIGLGLLYIILTLFGYLQTRIMSMISQRILFKLRHNIFHNIQNLPIAFFNQNKAGDLMSRIIGDIDRLNQLMSETISRFIGSFFVIFGIGVFILILNRKLGLVGLISCFLVIALANAISPFIGKLNIKNLNNVGELGAITEQNLTNFKVIVAFNRRDYFRNIFDKFNQITFQSALKAGVGNEFYKSIYDLSGNLAQVLVLFYGVYLVFDGQITIGLLIGFILYIQKFYEPLKMIGSLWGSIQQSTASWIRVNQIINLKSDLKIINNSKKITGNNILVFDNVYFGYKDDSHVLKDVCLHFEKGKTYALIGPTGGGKSTTASLMLRLYDPCKGIIYFDNKDIRSYNPELLAQNIGFIQQEPFIFEGTIQENIQYGNDNLLNLDSLNLLELIKNEGFEEILTKFPDGLSTKTNLNGDNLSLGQKQLISFIRIALRKPKLLILDEATANIDTITEQLLNIIIEKMPVQTTKVIIAHRLNTIKKADEIIFINEGKYTKAINFDDALNLINNSGIKS